jgi:hypothetical protein
VDFVAGTVPAIPPPVAPKEEPAGREQGKGASGGVIVAAVGFTVAGLGGGLGAVTGLMSLSKTSSVKSTCNGNVCPPSSAGDISTAGTLATVSDVGFIVGGVGLAVGVVGVIMLATGSKQPPQVGHKASVMPYVGLESGLMGTF